MKTIKIKDYVSNDKIANSIITDFSTNKYIIKGSTGIGGTSAVLNIKDQNIVIISPLTGMIASKEQKGISSQQFFIHGTSKQKWQEWFRAIKEGNCVVNTTPEQIIELKKHHPEIFNELVQCNFFIDEFDILALADYRESLRDFYQIIFKQIEGGIIISTATPVYHHLDIPATILADMEIIQIERIEETKKELIIEPHTNYYNFVKQERDAGNKVILFTNDLNQIKNIIMNEELSGDTQTLLGKSLHTKRAKAKAHTIEEDELNDKAELDPTKSIYILSSKYLIGFDIEFDASIGIICDQLSEVNKLSYNEIIQAYGRVRNKVNIAKLFYRTVGSQLDINLIEKQIRKVEFSNNENYLEQTQPNIIALLHHITYSKLFTSIMNEYGFNLKWNNMVIDNENQQLLFPVKYSNLIEQDEYLIHKQLSYVYTNIQGDFDLYNGFGKADLLLYATAYLAKRTENPYLMNNPAQRYSRLLEAAKTFIDVNPSLTVYDGITKNKRSKVEIDTAIRNGARCGTDYSFASQFTTDDTFLKAIHIINHLYAIHLVEQNQIDSETRIVMRGFEIASEVCIKNYKEYLSKIMGKDIQTIINDKKDREIASVNKEIGYIRFKDVFKNTNRTITNELHKEFSNQVTIELFTQIMKKANDIKTSLLKNKNGFIAAIASNTYTIRKQQQNHANYILSLLSLLCAGHMAGFKTTTKDNRDFNTITKCTRQLRKYTPYEMYQADIASAFATFVDRMVDSTIGPMVYVNIMNNYKVERSEAKKMYNSALNDASRSRKDLFEFFLKCGYTKDQTNTLVNEVKIDKGAFYRSMTKHEEKAIINFKTLNNLPNTAIRCHDALFWLATENKEYATNLGGIQFDLVRI